MSKENRYIQFPLHLLPELIFNTDNAINKILCFGIYNYSKKLQNDLIPAITQFLYYYYRKKNNVPYDLIELMEYYVSQGKIDLDEDYNGFHDDKFNPEYETNQIVEIVKNDSDFESKIIEFHNILKSIKYLTEKSNNPAIILHNGKETEKRIKEKEPFVSVKIDLLFSFFKKDKEDYEKIQLVAYLAIRSIIGEKDYVKTNMRHILSRMMGFSSIKDIPEKLENFKNDFFEKYLNRYHSVKLINDLQLNWNLIVYSYHTRGMYFAINSEKKNFTLNELALIAETKKKKNRIADLQQLKNKARELALKELKKEMNSSNSPFYDSENSFAF